MGWFKSLFHRRALTPAEMQTLALFKLDGILREPTMTDELRVWVQIVRRLLQADPAVWEPADWHHYRARVNGQRVEAERKVERTEQALNNFNTCLRVGDQYVVGKDYCPEFRWKETAYRVTMALIDYLDEHPTVQETRGQLKAEKEREQAERARLEEEKRLARLRELQDVQRRLGG